MIAKLFIITVMLTILGSLGSGLYYLVYDYGESKNIVTALTWRISLSIMLFLFLMLGFATGLIHPHGVI